MYRVDLVEKLPYSASLSKYKKWLLALGRQHKVSSQVQRGSVGLVSVQVPRRLGAVQRVNRLYAPKIVKLLTCVKGGHMEGHEPRFWMCECPVEKKKNPCMVLVVLLSRPLSFSVVVPYLHADWTVLP